ncbi:MAG: hypothetical protein HY903_06705 [Deltaproteobacteria bacterium]|nr:hypothetical protein [Deltaproteobacteria bacterium]
MRTMAQSLVLTVVVAAWATVAYAAADTLVVKGKDGSYQPGAAKSWKAADTGVQFVLADGVDGAAVAKTLGDRLAGAKVSFEGGQLTIAGVPKDALLDQLSTLSLSGSADPLADLAGLGGAVTAMNSPEGGGSIRASKPTATTMRPSIIKEHNADERYEAEVVEIKQGTFPTVMLKLKVRKTARAGALRTKLRYGKVIEAPVAYTVGEGGVDLTRDDNKRNLVSWYLTRGDRVLFHPNALDAERLEIDWITRQE